MKRELIVVVLVLFLKNLSFAGTDLKKTIEFIAFSSDHESYLIKVVDENIGTLLIVKKTANGSKIKQMQVTKANEEDAIKKLEKTYKLTDKGTHGNASPDGKYTIMGAKKNEIFKLIIMKGEKTTNFKDIELKKDEDKAADAILKQVIWSSEGEYVVIILHQKLVSSWGVDADFDYSFEFRKSAIQFK